MSLVKVQHKGQMTIPKHVRSAVRLADGGLVDVVDRSKFSNANDEYTPEQRRIIDARLRPPKTDEYFACASVPSKR
jgi:AbrB family looped-hinge helix DNA binding protein